jgi:hypothetical protein
MARRKKKNPESSSSGLGEVALSVAGFFALPIVGGFLARASMQAYPPDGAPGAGPTSALATRTTVIDGIGAAAAMFGAAHIKDESVQRFVRAGSYGLLFAAMLNPTVAAARTLQLAPAVAREAA